MDRTRLAFLVLRPGSAFCDTLKACKAKVLCCIPPTLTNQLALTTLVPVHPYGCHGMMVHLHLGSRVGWRIVTKPKDCLFCVQLRDRNNPVDACRVIGALSRLPHSLSSRSSLYSVNLYKPPAILADCLA